MKTSGIILLFILLINDIKNCNSQGIDTLVEVKHKLRKAQIYLLNQQEYVYPKPTFFRCITSQPKTFKLTLRNSFTKKSLGAWTVITGSTIVLLAGDQRISDAVQQFSRYIHLDNRRKYKDFIPFKIGNSNASIYQAPDNLNTAIYNIGEEMPAVLLSAGLALHGIIKKDYRASSTASQILQGTIAMGMSTQLLKRITGRESPFTATKDGGAWKLFVNPKTYQQHVANHDAFPSGHMGTMMTTTTILAENYPEKRWIKPVGYSIITIVGLSMINNGVHWASDYPLAIGMGYVFGKATVKLNRWIKNEKAMK